MYSRILVAVDGSPHSEHALKHATALAKGLAASLRIVHVVDMGVLPLAPELAIDIEGLARGRRAAGEKILAAALKTVRAAGLETETQLLETATPAQHVADVLADESARWPADVVVLGTHGRRGVQRLLLGSVAEGTTRVSRVPVLLVPLQAGSEG